MIVTADSGGGDERAHGEGVDEAVVEVLVGEGAGCGNAAFTADGLGRDAARHFLGFEECERGEIDAESVFGAGANPSFGVDGAGEVAVEVSAFGHAQEEVVKLERILADGFEGAGGALLGDSGGFGGGRGGWGWGGVGGGGEGGGE